MTCTEEWDATSVSCSFIKNAKTLADRSLGPARSLTRRLHVLVLTPKWICGVAQCTKHEYKSAKKHQPTLLKPNTDSHTSITCTRLSSITNPPFTMFRVARPLHVMKESSSFIPSDHPEQLLHDASALAAWLAAVRIGTPSPLNLISSLIFSQFKRSHQVLSISYRHDWHIFFRGEGRSKHAPIMLGNTLSDVLRDNDFENFWRRGRPPGLPISQTVFLNVDILDQIFVLHADKCVCGTLWSGGPSDDWIDHVDSMQSEGGSWNSITDSKFSSCYERRHARWVFFLSGSQEHLFLEIQYVLFGIFLAHMAHNFFWCCLLALI